MSDKRTVRLFNDEVYPYVTVQATSITVLPGPEPCVVLSTDLSGDTEIEEHRKQKKIRIEAEHEYRGWKIKIADVYTQPSPRIQVWKPGYNPQEGGDVVVPFITHAASWNDAHIAALQTARDWIDREDSP